MLSSKSNQSHNYYYCSLGKERVFLPGGRKKVTNQCTASLNVRTNQHTGQVWFFYLKPLVSYIPCSFRAHVLLFLKSCYSSTYTLVILSFYCSILLSFMPRVSFVKYSHIVHSQINFKIVTVFVSWNIICDRQQYFILHKLSNKHSTYALIFLLM